MAHLGKCWPHDSARLHVTGEAVYIDDMPPLAQRSPDRFRRQSPGARPHQGDRRDARRGNRRHRGHFHVSRRARCNTFGPIFHDEELLATDECHYIGQPIVLLAGTNRRDLQAAQPPCDLEMDELPAVLTIDEAIAEKQFIGPTAPHSARRRRGGVRPGGARLQGTLLSAGRSISTWSLRRRWRSPAKMDRSPFTHRRRIRAKFRPWSPRCLGLQQSQVVCVCRRMGGGFGGKETQAAHPAILAALVARSTRRPARIIFCVRSGHASYRQTSSVSARYRVALQQRRPHHRPEDRFLLQRRLLGRPVACRHGANADPRGERLLRPRHRIEGTVCRTNLPSNTAFRGFGGPQAIAAIESIVEDIAATLGLDALEIRRRNLLRHRHTQCDALRPDRRQQHACRRSGPAGGNLGLCERARPRSNVSTRRREPRSRAYR